MVFQHEAVEFLSKLIISDPLSALLVPPRSALGVARHRGHSFCGVKFGGGLRIFACGFGMFEGSSFHACDQIFGGLVAGHLLGEVKLQLADHLPLFLLAGSPTSQMRDLLDLLNFREQIGSEGERKGCWGGEFGATCDEGSGAAAQKLPLELLVEGTTEGSELVGVRGALLSHKFIYYSSPGTTKFPKTFPFETSSPYIISLHYHDHQLLSIPKKANITVLFPTRIIQKQTASINPGVYEYGCRWVG